ncbi:MFS transporter [Kineosporia sp. A_224]|uniref:MFS transporter n=1 Tax=Kineosporia sp. A_224 TaxID=1962180 RepID=UPI000B4AFA0F|nr:MFS transporter [Kineosporia sp. A_224]
MSADPAHPSGRATAGPLRSNRDFRLLWIGQSLSSLGGAVSGVAFPLLVLATTGSATKAGLAGLAANAPFVLLQLPAGAYVDRWNRRAVMLCADAGRAAAVGSVAVALVLGALTYWQILVVAALESSCLVVFRLAEGAALKAVVPDESQLGTAIALNQARSYGTSLAGDPLGGFLFGIRHLLPFVVDAVSYVVSLMTVAAIRTPLPAPTATGTRHLGREIREGLTAAWSNRFLRTASLLTAGSDFVINGLFLITIVIASRHGASPAQIGVMLAIGGAGGLLGALTAPKLAPRIPSLRFVIAGVAWVAVPAILLMTTSANPLALGALLALILSVWPLYNAVVVARWMAQVPDNLIGRVQGAVALLGWAPVPLAPLLGGVLLDHLGGVVTLTIFAALMTAVAVAASLSQDIRTESQRPPLNGRERSPDMPAVEPTGGEFR